MLQVIGPDIRLIESVLDEIRRLAAERSVFRGQVITFEPEVFGVARQARAISFLSRPAVDRSQIVLPDGLLEEIERQGCCAGPHCWPPSPTTAMARPRARTTLRSG